MSSVIIAIGILVVVLGLMCRKEEKRRSDFEDYVWYKFEDHGWNSRKKKHKH